MEDIIHLKLDWNPRKGDLEGNWNRLRALITYNLVGEAQQANLRMTYGLLQDQVDKQGTWLGLKRAPAAKGNHHAFEGGLIYHMLEMWQVYQHMKAILPQEIKQISEERVLQAILLHDVHKAYKTYLLKRQEPWEVDYGNDDTDMLMTSDVKSMWIAMEYRVPLDPEQINALLWAEGGFAKIKPRWTTVLAKLCYLLDEMSGNVLARIQTRTLLDHRNPVS